MSKPMTVQKQSPLASALTAPGPDPAYRFANRMARMPVSAIREILKVTEHPEIISFAGGMPAPELFPVEALAKAHAAVFADEGAAAMQYSTTEGYRPLREWIARRLRARGISATADTTIITSGSQQGIDLTAKVFINRGDAVVVENPSYLAAIQAFNGYEASFIPIESDDDGMRVEQLEQALKSANPKLIYIVSDFHNPKGTTLSRERRERLIELATRYRVPILEDDPYFELRYMGEKPTPLAGMDRAGLVIYLSTFSKTISPGMRIGWLAASPEIIQMLVIAKQAADLHTSTIEQRAASRLLESFDYDGHIARLCEVYRKRCLAMRNSIENYFPEGVRWTRPEGGLFLWVELPEEISGEELFEDALKEKVAFVPGTSFFANEPRLNFIRLNFSNQPPDKIEEGIRRIAKVLNRRLR
ncbi:MAG TPA: PLP-dependent aminotransferase family protein [Blastocatellia bacterium]|nr:PLP-dependent aminotransferase family protein [Blastocatellia bacterium]